ncbi:MAG: cytochrome c [Hyphomicrobium sp.]|nr:cytochrome c [Hyphomicrobium sp.]
MNLAIGFYFAVLASTLPSAAATIDSSTLNTGEALLQTHCSRCHAIGKDGASSHEKAPPFRTVMERYPAENLAEALAEGIVSGHPDMPEFVFKTGEIDAIINYLNSLKPPAKP